MEYEEYGSAEYSDDTVPTEVPSNAADAISLWLVFGGCVFAALVINVLYHCWLSKPPGELTEGLVNAVSTGNDDDEDDLVFGKEGVPPTYRTTKIK